MSFKEKLRVANIGNDDKIGDNPEATLHIVRAGREHSDTQRVQDRVAELEALSSGAPRFSVKALAKKIVGAGKPVSEFRPSESAELGNASGFPDAPHADVLHVPADVEPTVVDNTDKKIAA